KMNRKKTGTTTANSTAAPPRLCLTPAPQPPRVRPVIARTSKGRRMRTASSAREQPLDGDRFGNAADPGCRRDVALGRGFAHFVGECCEGGYSGTAAEDPCELRVLRPCHPSDRLPGRGAIPSYRTLAPIVKIVKSGAIRPRGENRHSKHRLPLQRRRESFECAARCIATRNYFLEEPSAQAHLRATS